MSWLRLEYHTGTDDFDESLAARTADPLWYLARQRQVGEFVGEDTASPIGCTIATEFLPIVEAGPPGDVRPLNGAPPESALQAEPVLRGPAALRHLVDDGLALLRTLAIYRLRAVADHLLAEFPIYVNPAPEDPEGAVLAALAAGSVDAQGVRAHVARHGLSSIAGRGNADRLLEAWDAWNGASRIILDSDDEPDSWQPRRLSYDGELIARKGSRTVAVTVDDHGGGEIRWFDLDVSAVKGRAPRLDSQVSVPTGLRFPGMPSKRWWEFEDAEVHFGGMEGGDHDATSAIIAAFATGLADDWYLIPVRYLGSGVMRVASLTVRDSFGATTEVRPVRDSDGADPSFRMFELSNADGSPSEWLVLLGPRGLIQAGPAVEDVVFTRDEVSNLAWAVERSIQYSSGASGRRQTMPNVPDSDQLLWLHQPTIADSYIPLVPVRESGYEMTLRRGRMSTWKPHQGPHGRILRPGEPLYIDEEVVPNAGLSVERRHYRARDRNGHIWEWCGRQRSREPVPPIPAAVFDALKAPRSETQIKKRP